MSFKNKTKQINLLTAGGQLYHDNACMVHDNKFAYCSPLSVYIYEVLICFSSINLYTTNNQIIFFQFNSLYNEFNLNSLICNHSDLITSIDWNPNDSDLIVTGGKDSKIVVWNITQQKIFSSFNDLKGIFLNNDH